MKRGFRIDQGQVSLMLMDTDENAVKLTTLITSELQTLLKLRFGEVSPCSENNKFLSSLIKF